ncbi:hypothetical protein RIF29_22063 [Crotalaria pallida]|uniref:Uncharacterized protein n=1 Tax=Crotalaria pallida TaxID=3830 RepID=A0AAN9F8J5_CROPI
MDSNMGRHKQEEEAKTAKEAAAKAAKETFASTGTAAGSAANVAGPAADIAEVTFDITLCDFNKTVILVLLLLHTNSLFSFLLRQSILRRPFLPLGLHRSIDLLSPQPLNF